MAHRLNLSSEGFKFPPRGREAGRDLTLIRQIKVFSVGLIIIQRAIVMVHVNIMLVEIDSKTEELQTLL